MNLALATGLGAIALGLAGYVAGAFVDYPGRAFSLTLLMAGMALAAVGRTEVDEGP